MTRVHIRTDDDVYRVDAVWLGPPRATFPWRARYSAYGVGLLVMVVVMFLQRRLGIDIGFFSVAWALLITVVATRFVSRRIDDERPLLEWLTLFAHELRGPRAVTTTVGGALSTGHVGVRRERPRPRAGTVALPRGEREAHTLVPSQAEHPAAEHRAADHPAEHHRSAVAAPPAREQGFGPPSSAEVGAQARPAAATRALPPAGQAAPSAAAVVASWGGPEEAAPVRVSARRVDRTASRPAGTERAPGRGPRSFGPGASRAARTDAGQEGDGATPTDHR